MDLKNKIPFYILLRDEKDFLKAQLILISYDFEWRSKTLNFSSDDIRIPYYIRVNDLNKIFHGSKESLKHSITKDYIQLDIEEVLKC